MDGSLQSHKSVFSWAKDLLERQASLGIILMLPGALLLMVFMAYPFFLGIWLSLTDSMIGRMGHFIGLRNFIDLLSDSIFLQTTRNTFVYALVTVPFKAALGLGLALTLNNRMRFSNPIRAAVMMPWIVPTAFYKGPELGHGHRVASDPVVIEYIHLMDRAFVAILLTSHPERAGRNKTELHLVQNDPRITQPGQRIAGCDAHNRTGRTHYLTILEQSDDARCQGLA